MQPGVTVALATVWLVVVVGTVGAATLRPSHLTLDQYSPLPASHDGIYQRTWKQPSWKKQDPSKNRPLGPIIEPRKSNLVNGNEPTKTRIAWLGSKLPPFSASLLRDDISSLEREEQLKDVPGLKAETARNSKKETEERPYENNNSDFDDTFQDQGPGSLEIYKLDLFKDRGLFIPVAPTVELPKVVLAKSKVAKETKAVNVVDEAAEISDTRLSNLIDGIESPLVPKDEDSSFGMGGVPELQVGCEGLEGLSRKKKRSISVVDDDVVSASSPEERIAEDYSLRHHHHHHHHHHHITPISLDLDYEFSPEEDYEEMDELLKLKKLESTTKAARTNRGDIDATLNSDGDYSRDPSRQEKLPVRGDLGKLSAANITGLVGGSRSISGSSVSSERRKRRDSFTVEQALNIHEQVAMPKSRKLLWLKGDTVNGHSTQDSPPHWGFGEDEGVVISDELQTEERRSNHLADYRPSQQEYNRRRAQQQEEGRKAAEQRTYNPEIERIRENYEKLIRDNERLEEERKRRLEQQATRMNPRKEEEEERRRQEEIRRRMESNRDRKNYSEEDRRKLEERQREWIVKSRQQEREEAERESRRRQQEQERANEANNLTRRKNGEQEDERQRQLQLQRQRQRQRQWEEEQKVRDYIERNRPINVSGTSGSSSNVYESNRSNEEILRRIDEESEKRERAKRIEEERRRMENDRRIEKERRLQLEDYIRRNRPINVPRISSTEPNWLEEKRRRWRLYDTRPYQPISSDSRREHGPYAPTQIGPSSASTRERGRQDEEKQEEARRLEEERRREFEAEERRREAARREEGARSLQSRRYEDQRQQQEAIIARQEERRIREEQQQLIEEEKRRAEAGRSPIIYEDRRRMEAIAAQRQNTRQGTRIVQESQGRRENNNERRRRPEERRPYDQGGGIKNHQDRAMSEEERRWRRREEARLNALPVSARIIVDPSGGGGGRSGGSRRPTSPVLTPRNGFGNEVDFPGINPGRQGVQAARFPVPATARPPAKSPGPCTWAVVQCCSANNQRLVTCFESMGCPGINWDPNPCRSSIAQAARTEVMRFYAADEENNDRRH